MDHGGADARALTGAEINEREQLAREVALAANIARKDTSAMPPDTPLQAGESLYQTLITLPTRPSPRQPSPQAPIRHLTLFPGDGSPEAAAELLASIAPPRLEQPEEQGRGKRRKAIRKQFDNSTPR
jgi:hypothetical protein